MDIVAIGGCASVGKTTLALTLAERLDLPNVIHVDELRVAYESRYGPSFIDTTPNVWSRNANWLCDSLIASTRRLHPEIAAAIEHLRMSDRGGVIEGEGIEPALVEHRSDVCCIYVIEADAERLHATFASRPSAARFLALSIREQAAVVQMNRRYSIWLRTEAVRRGQSWVAAHPWTTLAARTLAVIART